jgi:hypothetical protein
MRTLLKVAALTLGFTLFEMLSPQAMAQQTPPPQPSDPAPFGQPPALIPAGPLTTLSIDISLGANGRASLTSATDLSALGISGSGSVQGGVYSLATNSFIGPPFYVSGVGFSFEPAHFLVSQVQLTYSVIDLTNTSCTGALCSPSTLVLTVLGPRGVQLYDSSGDPVANSTSGTAGWIASFTDNAFQLSAISGNSDPATLTSLINITNVKLLGYTAPESTIDLRLGAMLVSPTLSSGLELTAGMHTSVSVPIAVTGLEGAQFFYLQSPVVVSLFVGLQARRTQVFTLAQIQAGNPVSGGPLRVTFDDVSFGASELGPQFISVAVGLGSVSGAQFRKQLPTPLGYRFTLRAHV